MRRYARGLSLCLLFCVGLLAWGVGASQALAYPGLEASTAAFGAIAAGPLVAGWPMEGEGVAAAREVRLNSPGAVVAREVSRTKFEHLDGAQAVEVASRAFPRLVDQPAGVAPDLAGGQRIVGYPADNAARIVLPGGRHGLVVSTQPMAVQVADGRRVPIDLSLRDGGAAFVPSTALVGVRIPHRLAAGVSLPASGISLTPVDAGGRPFGGSEGLSVGMTVDYPNTQTDEDTLVKPTPDGFELDSLLRSSASPARLYFRVGVPAGARVVRGLDGLLGVMDGSKLLAVVSVPAAVDAEGTSVRLSTRVLGDVIEVALADPAGDYRYPLDIDPTVEENVEDKGIILSETWGFTSNAPELFWGEIDEQGVDELERREATHETPAAGDFGTFFYRTQGESKIYSFNATTSYTEKVGNAPKYPHLMENLLGILNVHTGALEASEAHQGEYSSSSTTLCSVAGCAPGTVTSGNDGSEAVFKQSIRELPAEQIPFLQKEHYADLTSASVGIVQEAPPVVAWNTTTPRLADREPPHGGEEVPNLFASAGWVSDSGPDVGGMEGHDPGVGILRFKYRSPQAPGWGGERVESPKDGAIQMHECEEKACGGEPAVVSVAGLPNGEDTVEGTIEDAVGLKATTTAPVKIDSSSPYDIQLVGLPPNNEIGYGRDRFAVTATQGSGSVQASGIRRTTLSIDEKSMGSGSGGSCGPSPECTATAEWSINGEEFPAGRNQVCMDAESGAGVVATQKCTTVTFVPSASKPIGPGAVNLESGAFTLQTSDVSIAAAGSGPAVLRTYNSRQADDGAEGPFGPQWQGLSFTGSEELTKAPTGGLILTSAEGGHSIFTREGTAFLSPPGDANLTLKEESSSVFSLSDQHGDVTRFTVPEGGSGNVLTPTSVEEPGHPGAVTYKFQTVGGVVEPTLALAPPPTGVSCQTLVKGCRALTFSYATTTTAGGEAPSEWGEYKGRLMKISFTAFNPATGKMQTTAVAQYAYDKQGRLRAEWNPQIEPALKTTYAYDGEGHLVAVTPAGQQPWLLRYGPIASDPTSGRLLSVSRPPASTAPANDLAPAMVEKPELSTLHPAEGEPISVSNGKWSNGPVVFSYQWERCNAKGAECDPISEAKNQSYTVRYADEESTLMVSVTATSPGGTTTVASTVTASVPLQSPLLGTFDKEMKSPSYISVLDGELLVTDTGDKRIEGYGLLGESRGNFLAGSGNAKPAFVEPTGIAAWEFEDLKVGTEVWVLDPGAKRLWRLEHPRGTTLATYTVGRESTLPEGGSYGGLTIDEENVAALLPEGGTKNEVSCLYSAFDEFGCAGLARESFGSSGSGPGQLKDPADVAVSPFNGDIYVLDTGNDRVEYFSGAPGTWGEYLGQFGKAGSEPGELDNPLGVAIENESGDVWVSDTGNDRLELFSPTGELLETLGGPPKAKETTKEKTARRKEEKEGEGSPHFDEPVGILYDSGTIYVVDRGDNRVMRFAPRHAPDEEPMTPPPVQNTEGDAVWTVDYQVPVSGTGAPYAMGAKEVEAWGQKDAPKEATALFPPDSPQGAPAKEYTRATLYYLDEKGRTVNVAIPGGGISATEYDPENDVTRTLGVDNRSLAVKDENKGEGLWSVNTYNSEGTELLSSTGPEHEVMLENGKEVKASKITKYSYGEGAPSEGGPYPLVTKQTTAALKGSEELDTRTTTTAYTGQEGLGWKLRKPTSVTANVGGLNLTHSMLYEPETGTLSETRQPANTSEKSPHASENVYYTVGANAKAATCGEHPEWAGLVCQVRPARQPETAGLPGLPVTTSTYNIWDEPETTTETVEVKTGKTTEMVTRTRTTTYDQAGRPEKTSVSSSVGKPLPTVTDKYSPETGALVEQSTSGEGTTRKITSEYNKVGQLVAYTDADGNTSTYSYDIDGRPETVDDGKGTQTYSYDPTTGFLTKLVDTAAGTFTASYDSEGRMLTEGFPNGLTAKYAYSQVGEPVEVAYVKTSGCSSECTWYRDEVTPSIEGRWRTQKTTFAKNTYVYDGDDRLTEVKDTPAGKDCTTRIYGYDPDSDRTSLTTRESTTSKCATKGGTVETHSYDEADRLIDPGVAYNPFGNTIALPAVDAGGAELTSSYYVDNQLQSMTQHETAKQPEETLGYNLDPAGRVRETVATGKIKTSAVISHYAGPESSPAWTTNTAGEWVRNIAGINGQLAAIQNNGETPVLQITNLHGDVVATAKDAESTSGLESTNGEASEYGVPASEAPPKYAWLGAIELPTELSSGVVTMGARSYVPQLGRFLQPDPDSSGSPNAYTYTFGDPLNEIDPSGDYAEYQIGGPSASLIAWATQSSQEAAAQQAAENAAARAAAERAREEAEAAQQAAYGPTTSGGEEEWWEEEWGEEEGEYEWASYKDEGGEGKEGHPEAHVEPAVLYQPLTETATNDGSSDDEPEGGSRIMIKGGPGGHGCAKRKTCHHHGGGNGGGGGGVIEKCAHGAAKGAVTGAAGGAAAGAVGGEGAGAGPGAVAGAVGGAVAGCLSEVIP
jgi:RHS repeat-associated protein